MKRYVMPAALLSLLVAAGCADRGDNNAQTADPNATPAATEPAAGAPNAAAPREGTPAARDERAPAATAGRPEGRSAAAPRGRPARPTATAETPSASPSANAAASTPREEFRELTIPVGTALPLELQTDLSSETAQIETPVRARLKQAVIVDGVTALPAGAVMTGEVTAVERAGRVKGRSTLAFAFSRVQADNLSGSLRTNPLTFMGEASKGEDATKIGAGAVGGAIIGGILGGGDAAAKGAAIGGAAGTGVVLATRGREVKLASGADLAATLAAPFTVRVPVR
jgi:hypothetical protein